MWRRGILLAAVLVGGSSGESDEGDARPEPKREAGQPAPPADAGTRVGHGANAPRVPVPRNDPSPPTATIVLATPGGRTLGEASEPPGRLRIRYFPPPQIERIRSNVGARLPSEKRRTLALTLGRGRCGAGEAVEVDAQLWGEAINGTGLEAVTPHLRLFWVR